MPEAIVTLSITAVTIAFLHTLLGPDHYIPFIVMSRARKWSRRKTIWITILCGIGHVGSSVVLGAAGVALGVAIGRLEIIEGHRGDVAAYLFIAFGLVYFVWGLRRAIRNRPHRHAHVHIDDSDTHTHPHAHDDDHAHIHEQRGKTSITPWVLFTVFLFGPCEPLIPILMYPAATESWWALALVTALFATVTIGTMLAVVVLGTLGVSFIPLKKLERYTHPLAGATITLCGVLIVFGL